MLCIWTLSQPHPFLEPVTNPNPAPSPDSFQLGIVHSSRGIRLHTQSTHERTHTKQTREDMTTVPISPSAVARDVAASAGAMSSSSDAKTHRVFVYGTLKNGFYNNKLLVERSAAYMGTARTCRPMRMVLGEYGIPYLFDAEQGQGQAAAAVRGELWEVDDAGLYALDVLEGVDEGMYSRVTLDVEVWWMKKNADEEERGAGAEVPSESSSSAAAATAGDGEVVSAFGYVTGPASSERGVGSSDTCRAIPDYTLDVHRAEYVPKHERAAGSLGTRGGGGGGGGGGADETR